MGDERREDPRASIDLWVEELHEQSTSFRHTGDISVGGVHLDRGFPKPIGTRVKLRFNLPGEIDTIEVAAEVVGAKVGDDEMKTRLRFIDLDEQDKTRLAAFIDKVRRNQGVS